MNLSFQLGSWKLAIGRAQDMEKSLTGFSTAWLSGNESQLNGGTQMTNAFTQSTWVYACVSKLARTVAGIPFRFMTGEESDEIIVETGPLVDLFKMPNVLMNRFAFWYLIVTWQQLRGEAFVIAVDGAGRVVNVRRPNGQIVKLCLLRPDSMTHVVAENELMGWRYSSGSQDAVGSMDLLPEEVVQLPLPNPFDAWRGLAPLTVARLAAQTDFNAAAFMKGLMGNNADTGLVVTTDQQPSPEQREGILAALRERRRKSGEIPPPLFLWGGSKVEQPSISNVDLQFLENRKYSRQEICAIFDVAQELLGFTEDANRSVADAARLSFMENRIAPYCAELEAGIEPIVQAVDSAVRGEFYVKGTPVMQAAQRARIDIAAKAFAIGFTRNECNEVYDLGMPRDKTGDTRYLPFSLQEVDSDAEESGATPRPPAAGPKEPVDSAQRVTAGVDRMLKALNPPPPLRLLPSHECKANDEFVAATEGSVRKKRAVMRNFFTEQQGRVLAKLDVLPHPKAEVAKAEVEDVFDLLDENAKLVKKLKPLLKGDLQFGGQQLFDELNLEIDFALPPQKAADLLDKRKKHIEDINDTTFNKLRTSLSDGVEAGDTLDELKDRVKLVYKEASDARAEVIAKTETNIAINTGRHEGMKEAGVERKGWQTSNLENTRQTHLMNEQKSEAENGIPIDEEWPNGLMYPGDPAGEPGEVINCRCFGFAVIDEKAVRRPLLKFEDWACRRKEATP